MTLTAAALADLHTLLASLEHEAAEYLDLAIAAGLPPAAALAYVDTLAAAAINDLVAV